MKIRVSIKAQKTLGLAIVASAIFGDSVAAEMVKLKLQPDVVFEAPAGTRLQEKEGLDSVVGTIIGAQFECTYDLGLYSDPLTSYPAASSSDTEIAGRKAKVIAQGDNVDAVHVEKIKESVLGNVGLTLYCTSESEDARQVVRAMFRTLTIG